MPGETEALLRVDRLHVALGPNRSLGPLDIQLTAGQIVCVTAKSGAGKTSLLRAIAGLDATCNGRVTLKGQDGRAMGWPMFRRRVLYLHQSPVLREETVRANLERVFAFKSSESHYDHAEALRLLEHVGLCETVLSQNAQDLSQGEQLRVGLVRALLIRPAVLLLDEPTSALDPESTNAVEALLKDYVASKSTAALIATHDHTPTRATERLCPVTRRGRAMNGPIDLTPFGLSIAALFVIAAGVVSLALQLGLERRLALATVRTVLQLLLVGYLLRWLFAANHPVVVFAFFIIMIAAAAHAAIQRPTRTFPGARSRAFFTLVLCGLVTTLTATTVIIGADPWYTPTYTIPFLGMVLGNSLTGISLCLDELLDRLATRRGEIEMDLAHGATRWEAARDVIADSVRRGMIPIINAMMVVGIVSLPGMMTGQILAGADPVVAVKYQILIMFMIAAATTFGCLGIALLAYRRLFNDDHQLEYKLIRRQE